MAPTGIDLHDARAIVEWVLGVSLDATDPRDPAAGHDFHLREDGRRIGAMVVARSIRPSHPQSWRSVRRLSWNACGRQSWVVRFEAPNRSGPDARMIAGLLAELERAGGTGFQRADQVRVAALRAAGIRLSPAERVLEDLAVFGVVGAEPHLGEDDPRAVVAKGPEPGLTSVEAINEAVEDEVWRPENRARFAGAGVGDRHLFVWLDPADLVAHAAMESDDVPSPPLRPPETTSLWVARRSPTDDDLLADRVWQTNAAGEWEVLGSVVGRRVLAPASGG